MEVESMTKVEKRVVILAVLNMMTAEHFGDVQREVYDLFVNEFGWVTTDEWDESWGDGRYDLADNLANKLFRNGNEE